MEWVLLIIAGIAGSITSETIEVENRETCLAIRDHMLSDPPVLDRAGREPLELPVWHVQCIPKDDPAG